MIYGNYHSHSTYCDGKGSLEDYVTEALKQNLTALGFSGHAPLPFPNDWTMKDSALKAYLTEAARLKEKYKERIELYTGLEIDYISGLMAPADPFYASLGLDFIIGSVHVLKDTSTGEYPGIDYTDKDMEQLLAGSFNEDPKHLVRTYYSRVRSMIQKGGFTFLGHMDVVKKTNIGSKYFNEHESWYYEEVLHTLEEVQSAGIMMEVNTGNSRWQGIESIYPSPWIIKLCGKKKIPLILNSDAHLPERLTVHFDRALEILKDAGYRETMILREGKWKPEKLE